MILKSYLANVKIWNTKTNKYDIVQKRVIPNLYYIELTSEDLKSGMKSDNFFYPDRKKTVKFVIQYVDVQAVGERYFSAYEFNSRKFGLKCYPEADVELIPGTEQDFDTVKIEITEAEKYLKDTIDSKWLEKVNFKKVEDTDEIL